jgi:hypothetical protein
VSAAWPTIGALDGWSIFRLRGSAASGELHPGAQDTTGSRGSAMMPIRRRISAAAFVAIALLGLLAQPVAAIHHGATIDCGSEGTYTIKTALTGAGLQPPSFFQTLLLEDEDGQQVATLVPFFVWLNGEPVSFAGAAAAPEVLDNTLDLVTCTFTGSDGTVVVLQGIFTSGTV